MKGSVKKEKLASGFTCRCGKFHKFDSYVYAHWDIALFVTCVCGRRWRILRGNKKLVER